MIPYGAVSFLAYSSCKSWFPVSKSEDHASYHHLSSLLSGSFAGFCATISTYPLDLLRTRFAAQQEHKVYTSLMHAAKHIVGREGPAGLYVGLVPTLIGIVPLMALQFGSYEVRSSAQCSCGEESQGSEFTPLILSFFAPSVCVLHRPSVRRSRTPRHDHAVSILTPFSCHSSNR